MTKRAESREFQDWLEKQIKDANLSPKEVAEFKKWLMSRDNEQQEVENAGSKLGVKDVAEFVAWRRIGLVMPF